MSVSAAAARLDGLVDLGLQPRRKVTTAKRRAQALGVSGEVLLWEEGRIDPLDVLSAARRDWLLGLSPVGADGGPVPVTRELLESALTPAEAERLRRVLARGARISSTAAATAAVLVAAEIAITLAWQEPLSYLSADRAQAGLERELDAKLGQAGSATSPAAALAEMWHDEAKDRREAAEAKLELRSRAYAEGLSLGDAVGRIQIPAISATFTTVEGAGEKELAQGPGHIRTTALPGQGRTTAIAGHRTTYGAPFGDIDQLSKDDVITLELPYGTFTYEVERGVVVDPDDFWVTRDVGHERLVLTTCHPEYSAAERLVVFARLKRAQPAQP